MKIYTLIQRPIFCSKRSRMSLFILLMIVVTHLSLVAAFADQGLREEATTLENIYQDKSKTILNNLLNPDDYTLVVTATLKQDDQKLKEYHDSIQKKFLPGLIISDPLGFSDEHNLLLELKQKVEIQVILADNVSPDRDNLVRDILKAKLHLNEESGDTIGVTRATRAPASIVPTGDPSKLPELTPRMIFFLSFMALLIIGTLFFWYSKRKQEIKVESGAGAGGEEAGGGTSGGGGGGGGGVSKGLFEEEEEEEEELPPKTPEEIERERDALEMKLAFAKGELIKLVKDYPSIVCRAAEEFFAQGKVSETTMFLEALGWENARKLFRDLDNRLWARIGANLRERERDPNPDEIYNAVHVFQRFALSFVLERAGRDLENPFAFLFHLEDSQRIDLLTNEDSFNIALIAIYSSGAQMGELLAGLPQEKQNDVLLNVTKIKHLPEAQVKESVEALLMRLERIKADPFIHAEGPTLAADFMRSLDAAREEELFQSISNEHPEEAEQLRRVRVLFTDLLYYPSEMVRKVIESLESEEIMKALVGFPSDFTENILSLLPTKRALMIQNDLYHMQEVPAASQCAEYRRKIVNKLEVEFETQRFSLQEFWKNFYAQQAQESAQETEEQSVVEDTTQEFESPVEENQETQETSEPQDPDSGEQAA